jgi:hypothetical protein
MVQENCQSRVVKPRKASKHLGDFRVQRSAGRQDVDRNLPQSYPSPVALGAMRTMSGLDCLTRCAASACGSPVIRHTPSSSAWHSRSWRSRCRAAAVFVLKSSKCSSSFTFHCRLAARATCAGSVTFSQLLSEKCELSESEKSSDSAQ